MYTMNIHSICKHYIHWYTATWRPGHFADDLRQLSGEPGQCSGPRCLERGERSARRRFGRPQNAWRMVGEWLVNGYIIIHRMHSWLIFWKTACVLRMRLKWNTKMNISMTIWGFLRGVYDPVFFEWCPNRWIKHVDGGVGFLVVSGFEQVVHFEGADRAPQSTWRITEIVTGELRGL